MRAKSLKRSHGIQSESRYFLLAYPFLPKRVSTGQFKLGGAAQLIDDHRAEKAGIPVDPVANTQLWAPSCSWFLRVEIFQSGCLVTF